MKPVMEMDAKKERSPHKPSTLLTGSQVTAWINSNKK